MSIQKVSNQFNTTMFRVDVDGNSVFDRPSLHITPVSAFGVKHKYLSARLNTIQDELNLP